MKIIHLLSGLAIGGKERAALRLAVRGIAEGNRHGMVLYDTAFRDTAHDFDPCDVPVTFLPRGAGLDLRFAWMLARHLRRVRPDIVHAHNETALVYAALASWLAGPHRPRIIATFHTWPGEASRYARWLGRLASTGAEVRAVSGELAERLMNARWVGRCRVIRNGVETRAFTPQGPDGGWRERLGLRSDDVAVGHVARFDANKRHEDMLAAARRLAGRAPGVVVVFIGQGPRLERIQRDAAGLTNVRFIASVSDMPPLLRSLDAIALCSLHEAAPLCLLEGMACGLPVVATAVGGVPCIVGAGSAMPAGLLVPPADPEALANAIALVHDDPTLRSRLAVAARARAEAFSFDHEWAAYRALYRSGVDVVSSEA